MGKMNYLHTSKMLIKKLIHKHFHLDMKIMIIIIMTTNNYSVTKLFSFQINKKKCYGSLTYSVDCIKNTRKNDNA